MPSQQHKLFDEFKIKYDKILEPVIIALQKQNWSNEDIVKNINKFIDDIFVQYRVESKVSTLVVDLSINAFAIGGYPIVKSQYNNVKSWLLKNNWFPEGLNLSQTIHKNINSIKKETGFIIKETLSNSVNWQTTAQKIYKIKDLKAELPKYIQEIIKEGKKVLQDPTLINDFNKTIKKYQKQIDKLSNLGYKNPRLQKAYNNIISQVKKGSTIGLTKGIDRTLSAKTKYYAERIARTEIASAYGNAVVYKAQKNKAIVGIKSVLSARHPKPDICDIHAKVDQYGMGAGVFPKKSVPRFGYHVNCMCSLIPVTQNQIGKTKKVNRMKAISKYTNMNPKLLDQKGNIPLWSDKLLKPKVPELND